MITIYNETKTEWNVTDVNERVVCLYKNAKRTTQTGTMRRSAHIIALTNLFNKIENTKEIIDLVNMSDVKKLSDMDTSIVFSKKDFNPFVAEKPSRLKDIFIISLDIKHKHVINISSQNVFNLEGYMLNNELNMISSLNNLGNQIVINLLDKDTKKLVNYTFGIKGNEPYMHVEQVEDESKTIIENYKFRKFRPSKPTHTILTMAQDKEQLEKIIDRKYYNVVEISTATIQEDIASLMNQGYKAVTLFTNLANNNPVGYLDEIAKTCRETFNVFYKMYADGIVAKIRY